MHSYLKNQKSKDGLFLVQILQKYFWVILLGTLPKCLYFKKVEDEKEKYQPEGRSSPKVTAHCLVAQSTVHHFAL